MKVKCVTRFISFKFEKEHALWIPKIWKHLKLHASTRQEDTCCRLFLLAEQQLHLDMDGQMADETIEMENQWLMPCRFLVKLSAFETYWGWLTCLPGSRAHTHTHTGMMYLRVTVLPWHYIPFKHILTWLLYGNRKFILAWLSVVRARVQMHII